MSYQQAREHRGPKISLISAAITADNGAPTDAVAATQTATFTGVPAADGTVEIGGQVYTWKAVPAAANEVDIGGTAAACVTNLVAAILATTADEGTRFGTGTKANTSVTAVDGAGDTVVVTAKSTGTAGNATTTTETSTNMTWGGATLSGGVAREVEAIELLADNRGQVRLYELSIFGSVTSGAISYNAYLWGDDSPTDLTADLGGFSRLGRGTNPGHVNLANAITNLRFRAHVDHLGQQRFPYLEILNLTGTGAQIDSAYLREVIERNA